MIATCMALICCVTLANSPYSPSSSDLVVLKRLPIVSEGTEGTEDTVLEVVANPCKKEERRITTRLVKKGEVVVDAGEVVSEWVPGCEISRAEKEKGSDGVAGEPVREWERELEWEWEIGIENSHCSLMAQPVRLASDLMAVLLSMECGFEHVHRLHELIAPVDGKLVRVWDGRDGAGPSWSSVRVVPTVPMSGGIQQVLFTQGFMCECEQSADLFDVTRLQWDGVDREERKIKGIPEPLFMAIHGTVSDVASGRALKSKISTDSKCRELEILVLKASDFPKLKPKGFVVAQLATTERVAKGLLEQAKGCHAPPDSYVKRAR